MSANDGNGQVIFKNAPVVIDTIHNDGLHAVKHANGRDWWVVAAKKHSNVYFILLFSPLGISVHQQAIGNVAVDGNTYGELVFSPDGSKLARFNPQDDLQVFDFDRCTGELSNLVHVPVIDDADIEYFGGLAWSADGRYLYAAEVKRLLQFDTWATDLAGSMVIVAEAEPPVCFLSGTIGYMELGPDGMIYSRPLNGQNCMHRIKHPERGGTACEFEQNYYQLEYPYANMPHFPNFRLGPLDGSPCDTLGLDNHPLANWRYDRTGGLGVDFTSVSWYEPTLWQWDFGDPASGAANNSAERNPAHTFSAPGAYEVCLTVSNAYGSDTKCKTVWVLATGAGEPKEDVEAVRVYPNPTTGLVFFTNVEAGAIAEVYNQLGQLQLRQNLTDARLDLGLLPNGVYVVRLIREGQAPVTRSVVLNKN
ncbi:MAG: PKD domain-containing protein [Saprospiraceae bacterium]